MGKKKKKKKNNFYYDGDGMYNQSRNDLIADGLMQFLDDVEKYLILEGRHAKTISNSTKEIKEACKNLKNGKPEKVFDPDMYEEIYGDFQ